MEPATAEPARSPHARPRFDPSRLRAFLRRDRVNLLIGPNGAGKSTLLDTLSGELDAQGQHTGTVLPTVAYQTQDPGFLPTLTVRQTLRLYRGLGGEPATPEIARLVHLLDSVLDQKRGSLSGGQWRLVDIAGTCLLDRKTYLFDEPPSGIDPDNARIVVDALCSLVRNGEDGRTVVASLHDLALIPWFGDPWIVRLGTGLDGSPATVRIRTGLASQLVLPKSDNGSSHDVEFTPR